MVSLFQDLRAEKALRQAHPNEPWMWKRAWAERQIRSHEGAQAFVLIFMALVWNAISFPVLFKVVPHALRKGEYLVLIFLIFPLIGLALAWGALYTLLRWKKYGSSALTLAEVPGWIGGKIGGVVQTKVKVKPDEGFLAMLVCKKHTTTGSGKHRHTRVDEIWKSEQKIQSELTTLSDPNHSSIPILFDIAPGQPETSPPNSNPRIAWTLTVKADVPGIDYEAEFEVPVFQTRP